MYAYRLAYDGRSYHGFQRQPDVQTIEGEVLSALRSLDILDGTESVPEGYSAAGRTDAGVSAVAQTVAFDAPEWLDPQAFNSRLPDAIRVWARTEVPDYFHATHDATQRTYRYYLWAPEGDLELAQIAADRLSGTHDFHNLTSAEDQTTRNLAVSVSSDGPIFEVVCQAEGFVHELVRRIASLIEAIATEAASPDRVGTVLSEDSLQGSRGVGPARPEPLVLTAVTYPTVDFTPAPETVSKVASQFWSAHGTVLAQSKVFETIAEHTTQNK